MRKLVFGIVILFALTVISCGDNNEVSTPASDNTELYDVTVTKSPSDGGTITPTDTTIEEGNQLTLEAESAEEFNFTHWNGDIDSTSDNPLSITVDKDYSITANFKIKSYSLEVNTEGEGLVKEKIVQQKSTDYESGTVVELTAEPAETHNFVEWKEDVTGNDNPVQLTIDSPKEVTAKFKWGSPLETEDCLPLDPDNIEIQDAGGGQYEIVDGNSLLRTFDNLENAKKARDIIQFYGFTEDCFVGRPDPPFSYWLANQAPPEVTDDVPVTEDCLPLDPDNIEIQDAGGGQYEIVDGNSLLRTFDNLENAKKARDIIQFYGFTEDCFVGRPDPPFSYWLR